MMVSRIESLSKPFVLSFDLFEIRAHLLHFLKLPFPAPMAEAGADIYEKARDEQRERKCRKERQSPLDQTHTPCALHLSK